MYDGGMPPPGNGRWPRKHYDKAPAKGEITTYWAETPKKIGFDECSFNLKLPT
ncbi:hypothetical protein [Rhodovulum sulfidophilum]|uniref:hypothetical protein n=1 Tax=Rhodovulum sulfidophilum TaxID=35806 RepID=UPI001F206666|nr:hypothetical protein [Rhodovulum sulfidophilum]MCE8438355.1 hypothetical protein [Rhodovulum sulfidophilum]